MKKLVFLIVTLAAMAAVAFAESSVVKARDRYRDSYKAIMNRQMGISNAEIRANEYRAHYSQQS